MVGLVLNSPLSPCLREPGVTNYLSINTFATPHRDIAFTQCTVVVGCRERTALEAKELGLLSVPGLLVLYICGRVWRVSNQIYFSKMFSRQSPPVANALLALKYLSTGGLVELAVVVLRVVFRGDWSRSGRSCFFTFGRVVCEEKLLLC